MQITVKQMIKEGKLVTWKKVTPSGGLSKGRRFEYRHLQNILYMNGNKAMQS